MYFTVHTHLRIKIEDRFYRGSRIKILNSSAKYWGGANTLWPPNQIIGGAMAPLAPPIAPPMVGGAYRVKEVGI